jgi:hypothetical protein
LQDKAVEIKLVDNGCKNVVDLDQKLTVQKGFFQDRFSVEANAESYEGLMKSGETHDMSNSAVSELNEAKEKAKAEVSQLMGEVDCKSLAELDERILDHKEMFQSFFVAKGKGDTKEGAKKRDEISHLEHIRGRYVRSFSSVLPLRSEPEALPDPLSQSTVNSST